MSAIPTTVVVPADRPRGVAVPDGAVRIGRALVLVAVALLIPGEAARIAGDR